MFPKKEIPEEEIEDVEEATPSELIAPQSLLAPAEVVDAYVLLNNDSYTTNQDIPVSDILKNMKSLEDGSMLNCRRIMIRFSGQKVNGSIAVRMTRFWTIRWKFSWTG